jgi:hypothetical protein
MISPLGWLVDFTGHAKVRHLVVHQLQDGIVFGIVFHLTNEGVLEVYIKKALINHDNP